MSWWQSIRKSIADDGFNGVGSPSTISALRSFEFDPLPAETLRAGFLEWKSLENGVTVEMNGWRLWDRLTQKWEYRVMFGGDSNLTAAISYFFQTGFLPSFFFNSGNLESKELRILSLSFVFYILSRKRIYCLFQSGDLLRLRLLMGIVGERIAQRDQEERSRGSVWSECGV